MKTESKVIDLMEALKQSLGATTALCGAVMPRTNPPGYFTCALPAGHADEWHDTGLGLLGDPNAHASWREEAPSVARRANDSPRDAYRDGFMDGMDDGKPLLAYEDRLQMANEAAAKYVGEVRL